MQEDTIRRFDAALPGVRKWIDALLDDHADRVQAVSTLGFERLATCFPQVLLERAKVVTVAKVPFPPIDLLGLPELTPIQQMSFDGITYKDTLFIQQDVSSESLCFHELVHVVQWARLGVDNFLLAYGIGLILFGYERSPLEQMAYDLQQSFKLGMLPQDLVQIIKQRTDDIWNQVSRLVQEGNSA